MSFWSSIADWFQQRLERRYVIALHDTSAQALEAWPAFRSADRLCLEQLCDQLRLDKFTVVCVVRFSELIACRQSVLFETLDRLNPQPKRDDDAGCILEIVQRRLLQGFGDAPKKSERSHGSIAQELLNAYRPKRLAPAAEVRASEPTFSVQFDRSAEISYSVQPMCLGWCTRKLPSSLQLHKLKLLQDTCLAIEHALAPQTLGVLHEFFDARTLREETIGRCKLAA